MIARIGLAGACLAAGAASLVRSQETAALPRRPDVPALFDAYCSSCHNDIDKVASFSLDDLKPADVAQGAHADAWERILARWPGRKCPRAARTSPILPRAPRWWAGCKARWTGMRAAIPIRAGPPRAGSTVWNMPMRCAICWI
jgi:hypothetical protein